MTRQYQRYGFVAMTLIIVGAIAYILYGQATIAKSGQVIELATVPRDPIDVFRGRYMRLGFDLDAEIPAAIPTTCREAYITFTSSSNGTYVIDEVLAEKPDTTEYYLTVPILGDPRIKRLFRLPFTKLFLNEKRAPEIEARYLEAVRDSSVDTRLRVRIYRGGYFVEALLLDGAAVALSD